MKVRVLTVAVFRSLTSCDSASNNSRRPSEVIADVSLELGRGALVERKKLDRALTLLVRSRLVEAEGDGLRLTTEGDHLRRRISHLPPSGVKKWIQEAVAAYSGREEVEWTASETAWSDAEALFRRRHRSRMAARLEIVEGLLAAVENWHFVSTLIGTAADRSAAVAALQGVPLFLTKTQAENVLEMRLSQRTALGRLSLREERDAIRAELDELVDEESSRRLDGMPGSGSERFEGIPSRSPLAG